MLLVGDSMAEGLRYAFAYYSKKNGHQFTYITENSSSIIGWQDGKLKSLIEKIKPTFVMISLGTNELFTKRIEEYHGFVKNIIGQVGKLNFVWIGPPNWKKDNGLTQVLEAEVGSDRFFRSLDLELKRAADGIHPQWKEYEVWAEYIAQWLMTKSRKKIIMKVPRLEVLKQKKKDSLRVGSRD
ncbi:hypothetical protein BKI52_16425 [marine bacterium AO1-C]|nr:hypothetical protein BKI52_16425 [marine bacterium AO1-C]